jgi:hypothetical protein
MGALLRGNSPSILMRRAPPRSTNRSSASSPLDDAHVLG